MRYSAIIKKLGFVTPVVYGGFRLARRLFWTYRRQVYDSAAVGLRYYEFLVSGLETMKPPVNVLEIGCNSGAALMKLAESFPSSTFHGIDICKQAIVTAQREASRRGLTNITFVCCDALQIDAKARFDVVCSSATLIYLDEDEIAAVLRRVVELSPTKILLEEIGSTSGSTVKSHFFAHNYKHLVSKFFGGKNLTASLTPFDYKPWTGPNHQGQHIIIERTAGSLSVAAD